jgi:hypothetical protein
LPKEYRRIKHHESETAGFIHIIPARDYAAIVRTLLTPVELDEYLSFRERLIDRWRERTLFVSEMALVGQYVCGDYDTPPAIDFE